MKQVIVVGAGLAGTEATWQLVSRNIPVKLYEMRPAVSTPAHKTNKFAELVCSNSFRGADLSNGVGLLKEELKVLNSLIMECAIATETPAGGALAVDREKFSSLVDEKIRNHPLVEVITQEVVKIPEATEDNLVIIATGPLTSRNLSSEIEKLVGSERLAFFDAISPIVFGDSLDYSKIFRQSRYDKGGAHYLNIPLNQEQYLTFITAVNAAEKYTGNESVENDSLDKLRPFEGCMPIEDMIARGPETLRFGPFKPTGLTNPHSEERLHAAMQLRQDDQEGKLWSLVGMQTRMKRHEQEKLFRSLPGMENAEFVRFGSVHRNTFIESPKCLLPTLQFQSNPYLFFAGQITGVEGYVESTAGGMVAGINATRVINGKAPLTFPDSTAVGGLLAYISTPRENFQPMNISYGLIPAYLNFEHKKGMNKKDKRRKVALAALDTVREIATAV